MDRSKKVGRLYNIPDHTVKGIFAGSKNILRILEYGLLRTVSVPTVLTKRY